METFFGHLLLALSQMLGMLIQVYIFIIIIRTIISWAGPLPYNPLAQLLKKITDPVFLFVHRIIPFAIVGGIDISPIIIIFVLYFLNNLLCGVLNDYASTFFQNRMVL